MSKTFPILDVISAVTGWYISDNDFGVVYNNVLDYLTGDVLFTHQLPEASVWAAPYVYAQYPWMEEVAAILQHYTDNGDKEGMLAYSDSLPLYYGAELTLSPIEDDNNQWQAGRVFSSLLDLLGKP